MKFHKVSMAEPERSNNSNVVVLNSAIPRPANQVSFNRRELDLLLQVYSRKVASGEWRDYAIDMIKERAVFSVFRKTSEVPLYMIEKTPKLARRQGAWSVTNSDGFVLKRGHDLINVLKVLEKRPKLVSY